VRNKQLNFYLNLADQAAVDLGLAKLNNVVFCKMESTNKQLQILESSLNLAMGSEPLKIAIVKRTHLKKVKFRKLENLNVFKIDSLTSPVIEYSRCFVSDQIIRRGRFYFNKSYFNDEGEVVTKDAEFLSWADKVFRRVKSGLVHHGNLDYFGNNALYDIREGVKPVFI